MTAPFQSLASDPTKNRDLFVPAVVLLNGVSRSTSGKRSTCSLRTPHSAMLRPTHEYAESGPGQCMKRYGKFAKNAPRDIGCFSATSVCLELRRSSLENGWDALSENGWDALSVDLSVVSC